MSTMLVALFVLAFVLEIVGVVILVRESRLASQALRDWSPL